MAKLVLLLCATLVYGCGSPNVTDSAAVRRANIAFKVVTFRLDFLKIFRPRVILTDLGTIQETCQHSEFAVPFHYEFSSTRIDLDSNIEFFVTRCVLIHPNDDPNNLKRGTTTILITPGDEEHICEETALAMMESFWQGTFPINFFNGGRFDPFFVANSWCACFSEESTLWCD